MRSTTDSQSELSGIAEASEVAKLDRVAMPMDGDWVTEVTGGGEIVSSSGMVIDRVDVDEG